MTDSDWKAALEKQIDWLLEILNDIDPDVTDTVTIGEFAQSLRERNVEDWPFEWFDKNQMISAYFGFRMGRGKKGSKE